MEEISIVNILRKHNNEYTKHMKNLLISATIVQKNKSLSLYCQKEHMIQKMKAFLRIKHFYSNIIISKDKT